MSALGVAGPNETANVDPSRMMAALPYATRTVPLMPQVGPQLQITDNLNYHDSSLTNSLSSMLNILKDDTASMAAAQVKHSSWGGA
jgi:hypothetical protein